MGKSGALKKLLGIVCLTVLVAALGITIRKTQTPAVSQNGGAPESTELAQEKGNPVTLAEANEEEIKAISYLESQLSEAVNLSLKYGEDLMDCYSQTPEGKITEKYPEKYDLRDYDLVTPVKNQSPWGTCWAFGAIAAAETSILTTLGVTQTEYQEQYGEPLDLSEKHLAWFTGTALPKESDYAEGEYPYDLSQQGEGSYLVEEGSSAYNTGGNYFLATSTLASGIGPVREQDFPYTDAEGKRNPKGDWSIDEKDRFRSSFILIDANVLPSPAEIDSEGNYSYNEAGTNAIKAEILSGRAVGIAFYGDLSLPKETIAENMRQELLSLEGVSEEFADSFGRIYAGLTEGTEEELKAMIAFCLQNYRLGADFYDLSGLNRQQLRKVLCSDLLGQPLEEVLAYEQKQYMTFIPDDEGNTIWAQYTGEALQSDHDVCVVGWDDTFPASSFPEGAQPPGDGAWIVKNSWGTSWGMEGYFYLSYYDMTINECQSFEFTDRETDTLEIVEKDFMPVEAINSTLMDVPVTMGVILETETDAVPQYISLVTGDVDAEYTVSLYLLEESSATPTDGMLLATGTDTARLGGYHRVKLANNIVIPAGSRLGVTVMERVETGEGMKYAMVCTSSLGEAYVEYKEETDPDNPAYRYCKAILNKGESFLSFGEGRWIDWGEMVDSYYAKGGNFRYMQYDNLPVKIFSLLEEDVTKLHDFTTACPVPGGTAEICSDCGYALTVLAG